MDLLQIKNGKIVDGQDQPVRLRGTCVGGWMNMENFINGTPGAEHTLRRYMAEVLGPAKAEFFFTRLLDYMLAEEDIAFMKSCGATVVRLPVNYHHFERDAEPYKYLDAGFERLSRAIFWCEKHGLYAILDLHSCAGWQNTDWHCDNDSRHALFWIHKDFQDRFVALWEELARRFQGQAALAGYNVMNEPVTGTPNGRFQDGTYISNWDALNSLYRRVVSAIRKIDSDHIIFLEGDCFSALFDGLEPPFAENLAYSSHNYTGAGFGPGPYPGDFWGSHWDRQKQEEVFLSASGTRFAHKHNVPLWVGEYGSVFHGPPGDLAYRLQAFQDQTDAFETFGAHWTTWTYKDVGVMSWVYVNPEADYMRRTEKIRKAKELLSVDFWEPMATAAPARDAIRQLAEFAEQVIADPDTKVVANRRYLEQTINEVYMGTLLQPVYAKQFKDLSEEEIDRALSSFSLAQCRRQEEYLKVLRQFFSRPA
ncbi:MAG TPA: cellulase family glycosylhydrolase [Chthonomonadaceae bacterium]|nr:cellulase family glycosylhydrolase [Chthonomonadaceae bacterium]